MEPKRLLAHAALNNFFHADKGPTADEQDVGGVHRREFLVRVLASTLRWDVGDRTFQNLQQRLLHALTRDVAGNRGVLVLLRNLVDLVYVYDALLGSLDVAICSLQQLQDDIFDVFADVARFGECGGVNNGERHIEHARQRLRQKRFARAGGPDQQDVRLGKFHFARLLVQENALVVVVNRYREFFLGLVLADYIAIEKRFDLGRPREPAIGRAGLLALLVFQNLLADAHALVANVRARILGWRTDELLHLLLRFMAEGTAQRLFGSKPLHWLGPLSSEAPHPRRICILL